VHVTGQRYEDVWVRLDQLRIRRAPGVEDDGVHDGDRRNGHALDQMRTHFPEVLDTNRRIMVTPELMVVGQQRLFAIGDVTNLPENKMATHTKGHVKIVETNIRRLLQESPSELMASYVPQTGNPLMAVTLGSRTGVSHVPLLGVVRSAWLNRKVKAERMLVPKCRKAVGA